MAFCTHTQTTMKLTYQLFIYIAQRHGGSLIFTSHSKHRVAPARFRTLDFSERQG